MALQLSSPPFAETNASFYEDGISTLAERGIGPQRSNGNHSGRSMTSMDSMSREC